MTCSTYLWSIMKIFQRVFKLWSGHESHLKPSRGITQKVRKQELSFLFATHRHDLLYISVKYHENIPKGIQVTERTRICQKFTKGEITQKLQKARVTILARDTSPWPVLHNCEVSWKYSKQYSRYGADKKMFTDGQTDGRTDGRQAHRYIPRTFRSGDKKARSFQ